MAMCIGCGVEGSAGSSGTPHSAAVPPHGVSPAARPLWPGRPAFAAHAGGLHPSCETTNLCLLACRFHPHLPAPVPGGGRPPPSRPALRPSRRCAWRFGCACLCRCFLRCCYTQQALDGVCQPALFGPHHVKCLLDTRSVQTVRRRGRHNVLTRHVTAYRRGGRPHSGRP